MTTGRNVPGLSLLANVALASLKQPCAATAMYQQRADFSHCNEPIPAGFRGHRGITLNIHGGNP